MERNMNDELYDVALIYQSKLRRYEAYKEAMSRPEKRYEGWQEDLASDLICIKRLAREEYQESVRLIKAWWNHGQN